MVNLPPINAYGKIITLLDAMRSKPIPEKITQDIVKTVFDLKSSSYTAMIPMLKRLNFLSDGNIPTEIYREYKNSSEPKAVLGKAVKKVYGSLFELDENPHKLEDAKLIEKICLVTSLDKDSDRIPVIKGTFLALCSHSNFVKEKSDSDEQNKPITIFKPNTNEDNDLNNLPDEKKVQLSYVINLVLPNTTESEVFDKIFESLKRNMLI